MTAALVFAVTALSVSCCFMALYIRWLAKSRQRWRDLAWEFTKHDVPLSVILRAEMADNGHDKP